MAAATITTSVVTGGSNSHATTVSEINAFRSDFASPGVTGTTTNTSGIAPSTGSFAVNQDASPDMGVTITAGSAYITATPSGQLSQLLRAYMASNYTTYTISANASGSTKYDWIYLSVSATAANNPASDASDVTSVVTSRSSSNTTDNGTPPTYGTLLAVVTVANGASSITNANITDGRTNASLSTVSTNTYFFDFVETGCVWTADSAGATLNASMTSGYIWISGKRLRVAAVSARAFTASKDTYVDLSDNGDGTAAFTYTAATNNAASSALASGAIRIAIIVTGASNIAAAGSINQGQETKVLPIASSVPYQVTDSLGNLICPRDPERRVLGQRLITSDFTVTTATAAGGQVTGLLVPIIIPTGRKVELEVSGNVLKGSAGASLNFEIWDGTPGSGTRVAAHTGNVTSTNIFIPALAKSGAITPSATSKTYNATVFTSSGSITLGANSTAPAYLIVKLI